MIDFVKGILVSKKPGIAVIEAGGFGIEIHISLPVFEILPPVGTEAKIITQFYAKDNPVSFVIYGFSDETERECFRQIISVSGIGPKTAMTILSAINYSDFINMISGGNHLPLTSVTGVGRKTAERLTVELKDKIGKSVEQGMVSSKDGRFVALGKASEVIQALIALGYNRLEADRMVKDISMQNGFENSSVEDVIKEVLRGK